MISSFITNKYLNRRKFHVLKHYWWPHTGAWQPAHNHNLHNEKKICIWTEHLTCQLAEMFEVLLQTLWVVALIPVQSSTQNLLANLIQEKPAISYQEMKIFSQQPQKMLLLALVLVTFQPPSITLPIEKRRDQYEHQLLTSIRESE